MSPETDEEGTAGPEGTRREERILSATAATSWVDLLAGVQRVSDTLYHDWLNAVHDGVPVLRSVEVKSYRVTWEERHRDFPVESPVRIPFGRLDALTTLSDNQIELFPRVGAPFALRVRDWHLARVTVETEREKIRLRGREIERIDFAAAPAEARSAMTRIHGSVEDRFGRTFTGFISWNGVPLMHSSRIRGRDSDGETRGVALDEIASVEPLLDGARLVLRGGERVDFERRAPLTRHSGQGAPLIRWHRRALQIADPGLGMVEVPWDEFRLLRIEAHSGRGSRADFAAGGALAAAGRMQGSVTMQSGEVVAGEIRWNASREHRREHLEGVGGGVAFALELARIRGVERREEGGAVVTLDDGRRLELAGTTDLDRGNLGIFVRPAENRADGPWQYIAWEEIARVRFSSPTRSGSPPAGDER